MNKQDVIEFFDNCATWWDKDLVRNEEVINKIISNCKINENVDLLDVACGTGVLFPDYLKLGVKNFTAIDISPKMVEIATKKFPHINVICGDVETTAFAKNFDVIMVYNAFPHFPNPENLIKVLAGLIKPYGKISIAHGMSRMALQKHHERAKNVSLPLPKVDTLAKMLSDYFDVKVKISNDEMYQVVGIRKN